MAGPTDLYVTRNYTAVFTLSMPEDTDDEEWREALSYLQDHFNNQWNQTYGMDTTWTVTIHDDDQI